MPNHQVWCTVCSLSQEPDSFRAAASPPQLTAITQYRLLLAACRLLLKDGYFDLVLITFSVSMPLEKTESGMSNSKLIATVDNLCLAICG